ncbi:RNA polymerase A beta A subunit [Cryptosporidium xiaoi]|uniref:DNA-directed RNA polymerase n=1 Tax=Cryptosporidium xiaoi TaxID=659607 RepID=A0AAV9XSW0_9CRYT
MYTVSSIRSNKFCNQENDEVDEFISKYVLNQTGDRNMGIFKGSMNSVLQKGGSAYFGSGSNDPISTGQDTEYKNSDYLETNEEDSGSKKEPQNSENADEDFDVEYKGENNNDNEDDNTSVESDSSTSDEDNDKDEYKEDKYDHKDDDRENDRDEDYDKDESGIIDDYSAENKSKRMSNSESNSSIIDEKKIPHVNVKILNKQLLKHVNDLDIDRKTSTIKICLGWKVKKCPHYIDFLPVLRNTISKTSIQSISNLRNARITRSNNSSNSDSTKSILSDYEVTVEGTNVGHVFKISPKCVDHNRIRFNDIQTVYKYYGVEAARQCIINELRNVFSVYGINVDYRHLTLISDSITSSGNLRVFNRMGIICHNVSPFLQMSFETSLKFLTEACLRNASDNLKSPAGCISVGGMTRIGTGISRTLTEFNVEKADYTKENESQDEINGKHRKNKKDSSDAKSESRFKFL